MQKSASCWIVVANSVELSDLKYRTKEHNNANALERVKLLSNLDKNFKKKFLAVIHPDLRS